MVMTCWSPFGAGYGSPWVVAGSSGVSAAQAQWRRGSLGVSADCTGCGSSPGDRQVPQRHTWSDSFVAEGFLPYDNSFLLAK